MRCTNKTRRKIFSLSLSDNKPILIGFPLFNMYVMWNDICTYTIHAYTYIYNIDERTRREVVNRKKQSSNGYTINFFFVNHSEGGVERRDKIKWYERKMVCMLAYMCMWLYRTEKENKSFWRSLQETTKWLSCSFP